MLKTLFLFCSVFFLCGASVYVSPEPLRIQSVADRLLVADWERNNLALPQQASDSVLVRRLHLALAGRLPSALEARAYVASEAPDKYEVLVERLLQSDAFADYWTLHWADALRIKSEFPINLWPNAVYGYWRRVRAFVATNEPYDHFARALLASAGSNFRIPEANFYRANADKTPRGLASGTALTFLGSRFEKWPEKKQEAFAALFSPIAFKNTREWKEEIVYWRETSSGDPRNAVVEAVIRHPDFARAAANRAWFWFFGRGLVQEADDLRPDNRATNPELLEYLARAFVESKYDFRALCRAVALCAAARTASEHPGDPEKTAAHFAAFPLRRLDAEVLDDAIRDLTGVAPAYSSVIPEPFTFLPPESRTVTLADGSMTSSFLLLLGRPSRDSGKLAERSNLIDAKQRLQLFNSGELDRKLQRLLQREDLKSLPQNARIETLYWMFYARPPTGEEKATLREALEKRPAGRARWRFIHELCWALLNSEEFLFQH